MHLQSVSSGDRDRVGSVVRNVTKCFKAIFVGYEEACIRWRVHDLKGKYFFSRDIIFNEDSSGHLGVPHSLPAPSVPITLLSEAHPLRDRGCTHAGQAFDEVIHLKEFCAVEHERRKLQLVAGDVDGGAHGAFAAVVVWQVVVDGDILSPSGGAVADLVTDSLLSPVSSSPVIEDVSLLESSLMIEDVSLAKMKPEILLNFALHTSTYIPHSFSLDILKAPSSFAEAHTQSDAPVWRAAMDQEKQSLDDMGAFEEADLPPGEHAIRLKWVYTFKTDADGCNIPGKEKARVVAQGFNQHPGQYDETYTPVAKMASIHVLLAWAAVQDLKIFQFNCKTAFLHVKMQHPLYVHQILFPILGKFCVFCVVLYGLHQLAYEFYMLFFSLLISLGMIHLRLIMGFFLVNGHLLSILLLQCLSMVVP